MLTYLSRTLRRSRQSFRGSVMSDGSIGGAGYSEFGNGFSRKYLYKTREREKKKRQNITQDRRVTRSVTLFELEIVIGVTCSRNGQRLNVRLFALRSFFQKIYLSVIALPVGTIQRKLRAHENGIVPVKVCFVLFCFRRAITSPKKKQYW